MEGWEVDYADADQKKSLPSVPESKHRFVELNKPEDIAINDKTGKIFVTDTKNSRMQVFQLK